jgi:error-prone DNA polymerase
MPRSGRDRRRLHQQARYARAGGGPLLATADALYAEPGDRPLHDVLTCIRLGTTIRAAGRQLVANAERHLKTGARWRGCSPTCHRRWRRALRLLDRIDFALTDLAYEYPHEPVPSGWDAQGWLEHL